MQITANPTSDYPPYTLADLVNRRTQALYDEVSTRVPIRLVRSETVSWGAHIQSGVGIVYCSPSRYPLASFAHELLHLKIDMAGMACPGATARAATQEAFDDLAARVPGLLPYFYNQLIHHRLYPQFIGLGFPPEQFLNDADNGPSGPGESDPWQNVEELNRLHRRDRRALALGVVVLPYLFFSSPHVPAGQRNGPLGDLRRVSGNATVKFDRLLRHLRESAQPDMRWYLARLFFLCDLIDVGVGYNDTDLVWSSACHDAAPPA